MKLTFLPFLLLTLLSINVAIADNQKDDPTLKNIPKAAVPSPAPSPSSFPSHHLAPEADFNIHEACNNSTIKDACETTLKSLGGDKEHVKASQFAEDVVRYAQKEFGATAIKVREQMREDTLDKKVKIALSNCVKLYLDMADLLRGTYLGVRSKKFGPETTQFITMAHSFPRICEEGLHKAGTSGEKLGLYKSFKDLEDVATAMDAVIRYAAAHHKAAKH